MSSTNRGGTVNSLGAYDTKIGLCRAVIRQLVDRRILHKGDRVLEPSVGSGNWIRAGHEILGDVRSWVAMDIDPCAPGLDVAHDLGAEVVSPLKRNRSAQLVERYDRRLARYPEHHHRALAVAGYLVTELPHVDLVLGNPPYSVTPPPETCPTCKGAGFGTQSKLGGTLIKCKKCDGDGVIKIAPLPVADLHVDRSFELGARRTVFCMRLPYLGGKDRYRDLWSRDLLREVKTVVGRPSYTENGKTDSIESAIFLWDRDWKREYFEGGWLEWEDT